MKISIVTLNYKKSHLTIECMNSLFQNHKKEFDEDQLELIIVDNDSQDDSIQKIKKVIIEEKYKNVVVVENEKNGGFGYGCNKGAGVAKGDLIVFLNNDTKVQDKGITKMGEYMSSHHEVNILGGQLTNADGTLQASVGSFYTLGNAILLLLGFQKYGLLDKSPKTISEVDWVKGGLLMIRKDDFEKLHGFDEKIFMYTEDMELCYRARKKKMNIYFYPDVDIIHAEHGSTNKTFAIVNIYKNLLYFYKKHRSYAEYLILKILLLLKAVILITIGKIKKNNYLLDTYSQAFSAVW